MARGNITQKQIKDMIRRGEATELVRPNQIARGYDVIGCSHGVYGLNGLLIRSKTGKLYAIASRNSLLDYYF